VKILEQINGLDENHLSGYAEPNLIIKVRNLGYRVVMVGNMHVFHYDILTKSLGESRISADVHSKDIVRWFEEYPDYSDTKIKLYKYPFTTTFISMILWWICYHVPIQFLRRNLMIFIMWLKPIITMYPARWEKRSKELKSFY